MPKSLQDENREIVVTQSLSIRPLRRKHVRRQLSKLAQQEQPVRRKVALKLIKPGMDSHEVIARFEAERQALALMNHPNVAKVLDAGETESCATSAPSSGGNRTRA